MADTRFFKKQGPFKIRELAALIDAEIRGSNDDELIEDVATINMGKKGQISFLNNAKYAHDLKTTEVTACIISEKYINYSKDNLILLVCDNPYEAYAKIAAKFYPFNQNINPKIADSARIASSAKIGTNVSIGEYVVIGEGVEIGDNTSIDAHTVIKDNVIIGHNCSISSNVSIAYTIIGNNCLFHAGGRIGQDGFGFAPSSKGIIKIPQVGRVIIGNNVEIGANSCIDRGAINDTVIGDGTKIDNLVQIGHNVVIGKNCFICGQVGLAGSCEIGDGVMLGGQAGISGHISIENGAMIAAKSGVIKNVKAKEVMGGYPALPINDWHKITALLKKMISRGL